VYDTAQMNAGKAYTVIESRFAASRTPENLVMLETIAVILLILWALGLVSSYTMGGFIHVLLVLAVIVIIIRVIQGRRV
jgi:fatty acid desaturase